MTQQPVELAVGLVDVEPGLLDLAIAGVGRDADHGQPGVLQRAAAESQPPADGVLVRPRPAREAFADDDDEGAGGVVVLGEIAAGDQADTHRVEVAGQRRFLVRDRVVGRILEPLPFEDVADVIADMAPQRPQVDAGCRLDARDCPQPRHDLPLHRADLIDRLVGGRRQRNLSGDDAVGLEAEVLAAQRVEAGHQQRGADQQHERQGDLRRHKDVAQPAVHAAGTGPGVVTKRRAERHFSRLEERRQRAEQAGADRQRRRDREGAPVDGDVVAARQLGAGDPRQRRHRQPGDADAEEAAG